jgi:4-hydroxy-3-polyprenylbenzoate decarboxylase
VIAATGPIQRELPQSLAGSGSLPENFRNPRVCHDGILAIEGPCCTKHDDAPADFCDQLPPEHTIHQFPLIVIVDDSDFTSRSLANFLWVVFTRSNPAADVYGIGSFTHQKHWGCRGSLVIDARIKPHHAPPLVEDPEVSQKVDARASRGGPLAKYL